MRYFVMKYISKCIQSFRRTKLWAFGYTGIHSRAIIESGVLLDKVYPRGIKIGQNTLVAARAVILSHEHVRRDPTNREHPYVCNTIIGERCFIGIGALILPGVEIGNEVIVGAGAVVSKDVPNNSVVVGNPGKILPKHVTLDDQAMLRDLATKRQ